MTLLLVGALHRVRPHLLFLQMRDFAGFFRTFQRQKKKCACRRESECGAAPGGQVMDSGGLWAPSGSDEWVGTVRPAQLGGHVSSSTLSAHQMDSCRRARGLRRLRRLGAGPSPRHRQVLSLEQTYQLDHQCRAFGCQAGTRGMCGSGTRSLVSLHINSLRCLLGDGLRGEGLGIPSLLLGCHQVLR